MLTRKWPPSSTLRVRLRHGLFDAASFVSCRRAKEIAGFGYSDSAAAYDLEIFAAEPAGDAKLVAELKAKRETAINATWRRCLPDPKSPHVLPVQPLDRGELERVQRRNRVPTR